MKYPNLWNIRISQPSVQFKLITQNSKPQTVFCLFIYSSRIWKPEIQRNTIHFIVLDKRSNKQSDSDDSDVVYFVSIVLFFQLFLYFFKKNSFKPLKPQPAFVCCFNETSFFLKLNSLNCSVENLPCLYQDLTKTTDDKMYVVSKFWINTP